MRKSDKIKNIEEANKRLLGEDFDWTESTQTDEKYKMTQGSNKYDLSEKENLEQFMREIIDVWARYTGNTPNNAAVANDNRVLLFNMLMDGEFSKLVNQRIVPTSLHHGSNGSEYWSNNPDQMGEFLNKMGKNNFQLKPLG
jgi:hypothetical protein